MYPDTATGCDGLKTFFPSSAARSSNVGNISWTLGEFGEVWSHSAVSLFSRISKPRFDYVRLWFWFPSLSLSPDPGASLNGCF